MVNDEESIIIASAAPKPAPAETPKMSGDTNGFLNIPWNDAPDRDKAAPTIMAAAILGIRISHTTAYTAGAKSVCIWKNPVKSAITTSDGDKGYLPIRNDSTNKITNKITIMAIIGMFLMVVFKFISYPFSNSLFLKKKCRDTGIPI